MVKEDKKIKETKQCTENDPSTESTKLPSLEKKKSKVKKGKKAKNDHEVENKLKTLQCPSSDVAAEETKVSKKKSKSKKVKKRKTEKETSESKVSQPITENDLTAKVVKVASPPKKKTKTKDQQKKKLYQAQEANPENINIRGNKHVDYRTMEKVDFENAIKKMKFSSNRKDMEQYGNYQRYYGYRNTVKFQDIRMDSFKKEWFAGKKVLDIGCNGGQLTLLVARDFQPKKVLGCDIDDRLIKLATLNIKNYSVYPSGQYKLAAGEVSRFPENISFKTHNYVPAGENRVENKEYYDVIMLMSVSKWIHLNWGDKGLKQTFKKVYKELKKGGKFIFEPQPWKSYHKVRKNSEKFFRNYYSMDLKPDQFSKYLCDKVGFSQAKVLKTSEPGKAFCRDILMFTKPE